MAIQPSMGRDLGRDFCADPTTLLYQPSPPQDDSEESSLVQAASLRKEAPPESVAVKNLGVRDGCGGLDSMVLEGEQVVFL